jgi:PAS domain S-box-containing protein
MDPKPSRLSWLSHIPPLLATVLALAMLILTPVWALRFYLQPFAGMLLEPNNIVSEIDGHGWPARQAGAGWPEQLVAIDGLRVGNVAQVNALLDQKGFVPVALEFLQPGGTHHLMTVTPVRLPAGDFITLFVIPYLVGLVFLAIGLWAYRLRRDLRASRALLIFAAAVSVATTTFFDMNTTHFVVLLWALSLSVAAGACIYLALVFPQQMRFVDRWPAARFLPWLVSLAFILPAGREILAPSSPRAYITTWQASYAFMAVAIGLLLFTLIWRLARSASPMVRQQSRVIVFGASVACAPMMIFYLVPTALSRTPQEFNAALYFPLLILLPLSITYAILRYHLLDVDRILANLLTYTLTMAAGLAAFYGLLMLLSALIRERIRADNPLLIAVFLLLLVLGLSPLRSMIRRTIDRLFYRAPADYRRVLNTLASELVITPDLERTLQLLSDQLQQALAPEEFVIFLFDDERAMYVPHSRGEHPVTDLAADDPLIEVIRSAGGAVWFPPNRPMPPALEQAQTCRELGCSAFVPLHYEGRLIGFMALGLRRSGDPYTRDDLDFLGTVAGQSALALENARLFTNLRRTLDQTLEMKNLMDDIFASIATGVITTDVMRQITLFNRAAEQILGIPMKDALGKTFPEALPALSPDLEAVASDALERGESTLSREVNRPVPPRGDLTLRLSCSPLKDAYRSTKGTTIVFEDLTERRRLEAEQERIRQTFGRVVAPRVRDRLLSDPSHLRLDGLRQRATILFADLSLFTPFSESVEPEVLFKVLNSYISLATEAILEEEGTLDKFMGDAVLALWNVPDEQPDHALRAVRAALSILERARRAHAHLVNPAHHLQFHIGITTGDAMVGNVGTSELFNYTAIGDTVNLAQRLEVAAQPGQVLIDQETCMAVSGLVLTAPLEPIQVKGKTQPVVIYELKGLK